MDAIRDSTGWAGAGERAQRSGSGPNRSNMKKIDRTNWNAGQSPERQNTKKRFILNFLSKKTHTHTLIGFYMDQAPTRAPGKTNV